MEELAYDNNEEQEAFKAFVCPTCKFEITQKTMHGWVKLDFGPHTGWKTQLSPCPTCSEKAQARRKAEEIDRVLGKARIPFRYQDWSFASVPVDVDGHAKERAVFFANHKTPKHGLYLYGDLGQGKTGLAVSIIQAVMRREEDTIFIRSLDLMDRLREAIHRGTSDGDEVLHLAKTVQWLALDDLATEKPTPYVIQELKAIIETRMDAGLYTIITSNYSLVDLEKYWRPIDEATKRPLPDGTFYPGRRVLDRIAEYCEGVRLQGRNLRKR